MQTYLFDFDGTLVDSMPTFASIMQGILDEHHIAYGDDLIKIVTPLGLHDSAVYYTQLGVPLSKDEILSRMQERMLDAYTYRIPAKENVIPILQELKKRGCSLNVLTASPHMTMDPCLKRLGVDGLFAIIWSCDDFGMTKSQPDIYKEAAGRIGVAVEDCVFFDDNIGALQTAKAAGMHTVGVFDPTGEDFAKQMKLTAERYILTFAEMENDL